MKKTAEPYDCWKDGLRGRDLADCYKRFPNDLGPSEIALIQKYYPGFSGGYSRPSKPRLTDKAKEQIAENLVAYALKGLKARKGVSFLNSLLLKGYGLSYKQQEWFKNIDEGNKRYTDRMPAGIKIKPSTSGEVLFDPKSSSSQAVEWVEQNVGYTEHGNVWSLSGKPKVMHVPDKPPVRVQAPSGGGKRLEVLDALLAKRPNRFIQSIRDQLSRGRPLSENQLKAVRQTLYKNRMRSEADMFRNAMEHPSQEAMERYLREHPKADPSDHTVEKDGGGDQVEDEKKPSMKKKPSKPFGRQTKAPSKADRIKQMKKYKKRKDLERIQKRNKKAQDRLTSVWFKTASSAFKFSWTHIRVMLKDSRRKDTCLVLVRAFHPVFTHDKGIWTEDAGHSIDALGRKIHDSVKEVSKAIDTIVRRQDSTEFGLSEASIQWDGFVDMPRYEHGRNIITHDQYLEIEGCVDRGKFIEYLKGLAKVFGATYSENGRDMKASASMSYNEFWKITEPLGWGTRTTDYNKIKQHLMETLTPEQGFALIETYLKIRHQLVKQLDRWADENDDSRFQIGDDSFDDLTNHIIGLGKREYEAVLKNPELAAERAAKWDFKESFSYAIPYKSDWNPR